MTLETRHLIDLSDILSFEFECHSCHAKLSVEVGAKFSLRRECPLCNEDWLYPNTVEERDIRAFMDAVRAAARSMEGRPFAMKLRIATSPASGPRIRPEDAEPLDSRKF